MLNRRPMHSLTRFAFLLVVTMTAQAAQQPNILFIFTDDHATQSISAYGSKLNKTPNLDRLAKEGMLLNP